LIEFQKSPTRIGGSHTIVQKLVIIRLAGGSQFTKTGITPEPLIISSCPSHQNGDIFRRAVQQLCHLDNPGLNNGIPLGSITATDSPQKALTKSHKYIDG
jgi:hypothetical protein